MLNKLRSFMRMHAMLESGDKVICAVSGGADSVALLFAMYLLSEKMNFTLEAAHFNHGLRGEESDEDARFVAALCGRLEIPLHMEQGRVVAGKKGLEAAARNARYDFLESIPGKIATAHTADDNAETVLMHMVRGTGLRGLGGIAPVRGNIIRPMLTVTRQEVIEFLQEYNLSWREDSTNGTNDFLRNRLRHRVMPLLKEENPSLVQNLSSMALCLREDEALLASQVRIEDSNVQVLRQLPVALRNRWINRFLVANGVPEPEKTHIAQIDQLIFSENPSAKAYLPGGVTVTRCYERLTVAAEQACLQLQTIQVPCRMQIPGTDILLSVSMANCLSKDKNCFAVVPNGQLVLRSRRSGDTVRLSGGTRSLKRIFVDKKIPALLRENIPVIADDTGVLGVYDVGPNLDRLADSLPALQISFEKINMEDVL